MYVRILFSDNDFSTCVSKACKTVLYDLTNGQDGESGWSVAYSKIEVYGLEAARKAIVASSYGYYLADKGASSYTDKAQDPYNIAHYASVLQYLNENTSIELIDSFTKEWENSEVCYLDFFNKEVHLQ